MSDIVIPLPASLSVKTVGEIKSTVDAALADDTVSALTLDCSEVERVDALGLQLLLAVRNTPLTSGAEIQLIGISEAIDQATDVLGITWELNKDTEPPQ